MSIKSMLVALVISVGSMTAAAAQELPPAVTAAIDAALETCQAAPDDCAAAMDSILAAMEAAGLEGAALDDALISVAARLTSLGASLPPAAQAAIASAVQVVANNVSAGNPLLDDLSEVIAALQIGQGSTIVARLASPN